MDRRGELLLPGGTRRRRCLNLCLIKKKLSTIWRSLASIGFFFLIFAYFLPSYFLLFLAYVHIYRVVIAESSEGLQQIRKFGFPPLDDGELVRESLHANLLQRPPKTWLTAAVSWLRTLSRMCGMSATTGRAWPGSTRPSLSTASPSRWGRGGRQDTLVSRSAPHSAGRLMWSMRRMKQILLHCRLVKLNNCNLRDSDPKRHVILTRPKGALDAEGKPYFTPQIYPLISSLYLSPLFQPLISPLFWTHISPPYFTCFLPTLFKPLFSSPILPPVFLPYFLTLSYPHSLSS